MTIVFLDINPTFERAFKACKELGFAPLYVSTSRSRINEAKRFCDDTLLVNELEIERFPDLLNTKRSICGIWTLKDQLVPLASKLSYDYAPNSRYYSSDLVNATKNKYKMRQLLGGSSYNPNFTLYKKRSGALRPWPNTPVVIKPLLGYSSIGVEKIDIYEDFDSGIARTFSVIEQINKSVLGMSFDSYDDPFEHVLVEEYIDGIEVSAEVFANSYGIHCLGVCGKSEMNPPYFEEISYVMPAHIDPDLIDKIKHAAIDVMQLLKLKSGMAHLEFRITANGDIKLLDIGLRLGGGGLSHDLINQSQGIDIVKAVLAELVGLESQSYLNSKLSDIALLYLMQIHEGGQIQKLPDFSKIQGPGFQFISSSLFCKVGDSLTGYPSYSGLPGYALFRFFGRRLDSYHQIERLLENLQRNFGIQFAR